MNSLLQTETIINLCTLQQVWQLLGVTTADTTRDTQIRDLIRRVSREAMMLMERAVQKKTAARVEYFDCAAGQRAFYVLAPPIDASTTAPTVRVNTELPRDWSDSTDDVDTDYLRYAGARAARGEIYIAKDLSEAEESIRVTYYGGMASWTGAHGWDGASTNPVTNGVLTSAVGSFITDGVAAGYKVVIQNGTNAATWTVATVNSETQLTMTAPFTSATATAQRYYILDANSTSLIRDYPDLSGLVAQQVLFDWQTRSRAGAVSESSGGPSVTWVTPINWLYRVRDGLMQYRIRGYV